jgi:hypothetical protein
VTAAILVGSLAAGSTIAVICVGLTTVTLESDTLVPLAVIMEIEVTGRFEVAFAEVVKQVPVIVMG